MAPTVVPDGNSKRSMSTPELVCSFRESFIYKSDLRLLEEPNWLNDNLISFAFE